MTTKKYVAIGVRLFALALAVSAIKSSYFFVQAVIENFEGYSHWTSYFLSNFIIPMSIALVLWQFPLLVSRKIVKDELDNEVKPLTVQTFAQVLVIGLGLFFLYSAIVDAIYYLSLLYLADNPADPDAFMYMNSDTLANAFTTGVELFVSALIVLKSRSISIWMMRIGR